MHLESALTMKDSRNKIEFIILKDTLLTLLIQFIVLSLISYFTNNSLEKMIMRYIKDISVIIFWISYLIFQTIRLLFSRYKKKKDKIDNLNGDT